MLKKNPKSLFEGRKNGENGREAFTQTKNWYSDRYEWVVVQRNLLALTTLLALIAALASSYAVSQLSPLKTVKPFVIQVDEKTGATEIINSAQKQKLEANELIKEYFIMQYIRARESYIPEISESSYQTVQLMSNALVFQQHKQNMDPKNPYSPKNLYDVHTKRLVKFKSITFINANTAQVRVRIDTISRQGTQETHAIIWIGFDFMPLELTLREREVNPLGFQVTSYRMDEEVISQ